MANQVGQAEEMQQEAIEVGTSILTAQKVSRNETDLCLATEAMEKFSIEKVGPLHTLRKWELTATGYCKAHQARGKTGVTYKEDPAANLLYEVRFKERSYLALHCGSELWKLRDA
jgi:hypothetical protein